MVMEFFIAAGIVAGTIGGWMKLVRPGYRGIRSGVRNGQAVLDLVQAQLTPNGGQSLVDNVRIISAESKAHGSLLQQHGEVLNDMRGRLESLERVAQTPELSK